MNSPLQTVFSISSARWALGGILACAAIMLGPLRAHAAPAFVQSATGFSAASAASVSATFTASTTAGNLIAVAVGWQSPDGTTPTSTVTDDKGNVYTLSTGPAIAFSNYYMATYYAKNVAVNTKAVTLSLGSAMTFVRLAIHEYSGMDTVSPLDVVSANAAATGNLDSLTATTTAANEVIFGWCLNGNGTVTAGTGFSSRASVGSEITEDKIVTSTGAYNASCGGDASAWGAHMAAFKGSGAPTPPAASVTLVQTNALYTSSSVATAAVAFPAGTGTGNLIVVAAGWAGTVTSTVVTGTVTDDQGNTYASAVATTSNTMSYVNQIFYAKNARAGVRTVTLTLSAPASFSRLLIHEYSGADTIAPLDASASAISSAAGSLYDSGALTTTAPNDLLLGWCTNNTPTEAAGAGFAQRSIANGELTEDKTVASPSAQHATCQGVSTDWIVTAAAFKAADTVPPNPGTLTATTIGQTSVTLQASGASDAGSGLAASPYVFRNITTNASSGATNNPVWIDMGLNAGTTYSYLLTVNDAAGNTATTTLNVTTLAVAVSPVSVAGGASFFKPYFIVNHGAAATTDSNLDIEIHAPEPMRIALASSLAALDSAPVLPYSSGFRWPLCATQCAPGAYTIYAKFFAANGAVYAASAPIMIVQPGTVIPAPATSIMPVPACATSLVPLARQIPFNLFPNTTSPYIKILQQFLNANGFTLTRTGAGSPGHETERFGRLTARALVAFKNAHRADIGLTLVSSALDTKTRAYSNAAGCVAR